MDIGVEFDAQVLFTCCRLGTFDIAHLLELAHEEAVQVLCMRIEAPRLLQGRVKPELAVLGETRSAEVKSAGHNLDVPLPQCVVDDVLVLIDHDGAGGVHDITASFALSIDQINRCQKQLLLQKSTPVDFLLALVALQKHGVCYEPAPFRTVSLVAPALLGAAQTW